MHFFVLLKFIFTQYFFLFLTYHAGVSIYLHWRCFLSYTQHDFKARACNILKKNLGKLNKKYTHFSNKPIKIKNKNPIGLNRFLSEKNLLFTTLKLVIIKFQSAYSILRNAHGNKKSKLVEKIVILLSPFRLMYLLIFTVRDEKNLSRALPLLCGFCFCHIDMRV